MICEKDESSLCFHLASVKKEITGLPKQMSALPVLEWGCRIQDRPASSHKEKNPS